MRSFRGFAVASVLLLLWLTTEAACAQSLGAFDWNTDVWAGRLGFLYLWLTTQGASWTTCNESWMALDPCMCRRTSDPAAAWVQCNARGKVQEVHLSNNNLRGNFPRIAVELLLSSGVLHVDISNNSMLATPQPCVMIPRCLLPTTTCSLSPTLLCDFNRQPLHPNQTTSPSHAPSDTMSSVPSSTPTTMRRLRRLQESTMPTSAPTVSQDNTAAPSEYETSSSPTFANSSLSPSIAPTTVGSDNTTNITVSGGYASNDSLCAPWFTDNSTGIIYYGCEAEFTPPWSPFVDPDKPILEPTEPVTNETWCYTGNGTIYDAHNSTEKLNWGFCKEWSSSNNNTTSNETSTTPTTAPSSVPTVSPTITPTSTRRLLQNSSEQIQFSTSFVALIIALSLVITLL